MGPTGFRLPRSRYRDADPVKPLDRQWSATRQDPVLEIGSPVPYLMA